MTRSLINDKMRKQATGLPFTTPSDKAIDMSIRAHMKITPSDLRAGSLRPASRDRSEDARSGNIHQTVGQTKAKTLEQPTILERHEHQTTFVRINLLFTMYAEQAFPHQENANLFFFSKTREMVELSGIEPLTPCLQSRCSPS